jgi:hypothetical protein
MRPSRVALDGLLLLLLLLLPAVVGRQLLQAAHKCLRAFAVHVLEVLELLELCNPPNHTALSS